MAKQSKKAKAAKKPAAKVVKKAAKKSAPKKVTKPAAKKTVAKKPTKPAPKKVVKKASKPVKKAAPKKAVKAKPAVSKAAPKKVSKPAPKKPVKKVKAAPVKASKPVKKVVAPAKPAAIKKVAPKASSAAGTNKKPITNSVASQTVKKNEQINNKAVGKAAEPKKPVVPVSKPISKPAKNEEEDLDDETEAKSEKTKKKAGIIEKDDDADVALRDRAFYNAPIPKKTEKNRPKPHIGTDTRTRYSDAELVEFKELILKKLEEAQKDYDLLQSTLSHKDDHGTDDTSPTFKLLEDGSDVMSKEETAQLASRQEKFIQNLKNALIRIENKTYGICRVTGKLIPKERLRSVPHATLSIDAKLDQHQD